MNDLLKELEEYSQKVEEHHAGIYILVTSDSGSSEIDYIEWEESKQIAA
jgi:hypothetical protein